VDAFAAGLRDLLEDFLCDVFAGVCADVFSDAFVDALEARWLLFGFGVINLSFA